MLPVFGGYPDAFWDRQTEDWSRPSRKHYFFSAIRDDNAIGSGLLKRPDTFDLSFLERSPYATCELGGGQVVRMLVLDESDGPTAWKAQMWGSERLFLLRASLAFDGETLRLESSYLGAQQADDLWFEVFPAPGQDLVAASGVVERSAAGGFTRYTIHPEPRTVPVVYRRLVAAGPARAAPLGSQGVAQAPEEVDFERAETWEVRLPPDCLANGGEILLKIDYVGDVGRAYLGGKLVADHFYFGRPWEIGLKRFAPEVLEQGLVLKFLPLSQAAPVYLDTRARPDFCGDAEIFNLREIKGEVVYSGQLSPVAPLPGNRKGVFPDAL